MAVDDQGKSALLCRYVGASFEIPEGYSEGDRATVMHRLARLVSLVPFVHDNDMRRRRHDMWTSCAKCLQLAMGDGEEHATLLAGYFRTIGVQAYVVLGTSLTEAEAAWVLTTSLSAGTGTESHKGDSLEPGSLQMWDPTSGRCYSVTDPACQMRMVGAVFDHTNIWANVQSEGLPSDMKWDLASTRCWRPFFGAALQYRALRTLQKEITRRAHYRKESLGKVFYDGLEKRAENCTWSVLTDLRKRRLRQSTERNTRFAQEFVRRDFFGDKDRLLELEAFYEARSGTSDEAGGSQAERCLALSRAHNEALRARLGSRKVLQDFICHVFCLPMADNFRDQVEAVLARTGLGVLPNDWQYAVVAHVAQKKVPYVCGIWVYVAAIRQA